MKLPNSPAPNLSCPVPEVVTQRVSLSHGSGGREMHRLIADSFLPAFGNSTLATLHDGAMLDVGALRIAFTTDSYVVRPIFFPGGDIGSLAIHGTVNDLAMCGAQPIGLSIAMILEEGFPVSHLNQVTRSIGECVRRIGVNIVTGDTKVVERGKGDGIYINTSGIGRIAENSDIRPARAQPGDIVCINGPIAAHGMAIMSVREGMAFDSTICSDSAPLHGLVDAMLQTGGTDVHVLRDPTRGGLASALNEIALAAQVGIEIDEVSIPMDAPVQAACEFLGLDPLYVANEGLCVAIVKPGIADELMLVMQKHPYGQRSAIIGRVHSDNPGKVVLKSSLGSRRVIPMLSGEQLPRIC